MLSSGMMVRLNALELEETTESNRAKRVVQEITTAAAGVEFLLGLSAVVLGIIALAGMYAITLSLVAVLIMGISGFVTGASITGRMASLFRSRSI